MDFVQMDPHLFNGEHAEELSQIIWVISPTKSSGLLLRSTSSRCWACTRFGGYERLGIESVTSHGFCSDGPTTFQWLTYRVITDHLSHFPYKIFRLTASFHIFQILSLHSIWWIWMAWYWISYKSWILFRWTHNFSMVNMQKNHHRSFESFPQKIFRLTASFHIFQMLSLHSIWWIWKAWYWISYKSWILFRWTHNFSMVNIQKSYHRSFESFPYKIFQLTASICRWRRYSFGTDVAQEGRGNGVSRLKAEGCYELIPLQLPFKCTPKISCVGVWQVFVVVWSLFGLQGLRRFSIQWREVRCSGTHSKRPVFGWLWTNASASDFLSHVMEFFP